MKLALVLAAALALIALEAPLAFATAEFEASEYPATVSGEQSGTQVFALPGEAEVKCGQAGFAGELPKPSETLSLVPSYAQCTSFGLAATVESGGCKLVLHPNEELKETAFKGKTDVSCPEGKHITILALAKTCEIQISSQNGLSNTEYTDSVGVEPANVTVAQSLTGVHVNVTKDAGICPLSGTGEKTNATLSGNSVLKASFEGAGAGLAVVPAISTKLCKAAPVNGKCPVGEAYKAGTVLEATLEGTQQASILLYEGIVPKVTVECPESQFGFFTKEQEGRPLKLEGVVMTFTGCKAELGKTACQNIKMINANANGELVASKRLKPGAGFLYTALTLQIECGESLKCQYTTPEQEYLIGKPGAAPVVGVGPATPPLNLQVTEEEVGCTPAARLNGFYEVTEPLPVWVTR